MALYAATLQYRTTLAQAGWIAGLAGELEQSEAWIVRTLLERCQREPGILRALELEAAQELGRELEHDDQLAQAEARL